MKTDEGWVVVVFHEATGTRSELHYFRALRSLCGRYRFAQMDLFHPLGNPAHNCPACMSSLAMGDTTVV